MTSETYRRSMRSGCHGRGERYGPDGTWSTPQAVAVIFETLRRANAALDAGTEDAQALTATVINLAGALGMAVEGAEAGDVGIEELVARRQSAREAKDWATADALAG